MGPDPRCGQVTVPDPSLTIAIFDEIRAGGKYPSAIGSYEVAHVRDLTTGYDGSSAHPVVEPGGMHAHARTHARTCTNMHEHAQHT
jgi:hypothetical protein